MAAPSAPYCTSSDVYVMRHLMIDPSRTDYTSQDTPPKTTIETWIEQIAAQIDMMYSVAGYTVPFEEESSGSWPSYQTTFLKYFNAVGVAAMLGSDANTPTVTEFIRGMRVDQSMYLREWNRLSQGVMGLVRGEIDGAVVLRGASVRCGSPAEKATSSPTPPLMDIIMGYYDPTRADMLRDFTKRYQTYWQNLNLYNQPSMSNAWSIEYLLLLKDRLGIDITQL